MTTHSDRSSDLPDPKPSGLLLRWASSVTDANEAAAFLAAHLTPSYISHSELQSDRALTQTEWAPTVAASVRREFLETLSGETLVGGRRLALATDDGRLAAVAVAAGTVDVPVPFLVFEDLLVAPDFRGRGVGRAMITWILDAARQAGFRRVFVESGQKNTGVHDLIARLGFAPVSTVFLLDLDAGEKDALPR